MVKIFSWLRTKSIHQWKKESQHAHFLPIKKCLTPRMVAVLVVMAVVVMVIVVVLGLLVVVVLGLLLVVVLGLLFEVLGLLFVVVVVFLLAMPELVRLLQLLLVVP